ncbi:MAG: hypothetical protein PVJ57_00110 [Phycisphaerae bacterium]|jgi:hypothetical protein
MKRPTIFALALLIAATAAATARNVDLSTIPPRDSVQLTIYNSEDLTLVRETRHITFKKGVNPLQFSWANTLIDPTSVELRFRTHADELDLLDTTFPHDKPQMLYWNVRSELDGDAVVEITYFTSGITWSADYVCTTDPAETEMLFEGFVQITNNSGEDYADAQVRLVVGTINLVEKVADLARRGVISADDYAQFRDAGVRERGRLGVTRMAVAACMDKAEEERSKEIIKEGLSEYFIYTIEGTETIPHMWSKRMRSFQGLAVPFRIEYRYRPAEYGDQLVRLFLLRNDEASGLGTTPLPDGIVRLYRDNSRDGLSILTWQSIQYVPIGQEIVLNLGPDPEVIHERIRLRSWRDNFWFHRSGASVHYSPTEGHRIEINDTVEGWHDNEQWIERIRNYRAKPIDVEIRRTFPGHVIFRSQLDPKLYDCQSPQFRFTVDAGEKLDAEYLLITRQGYTAKQQNVTLEPGQ